MFILIATITYCLIRFAVVCVRPRLARRKGALAMIELKIPAPMAVPPDPLCYSCVYAHIVRGHGAGEELIACGYAFPMREVLFRVRECTDYRPKRERNRVEIANEGAVCILPLDETAADFHTVAATRNGEGELESSYD
ncbi:MAG: hypothetical protein WB987_07085 [Candidatus Acidiferrales bacterium]